jgi:hypothetical protein
MNARTNSEKIVSSCYRATRQAAMSARSTSEKIISSCYDATRQAATKAADDWNAFVTSSRDHLVKTVHGSLLRLEEVYVSYSLTLRTCSFPLS